MQVDSSKKYELLTTHIQFVTNIFPIEIWVSQFCTGAGRKINSSVRCLYTRKQSSIKNSHCKSPGSGTRILRRLEDLLELRTQKNFGTAKIIDGTKDFPNCKDANEEHEMNNGNGQADVIIIAESMEEEDDNMELSDLSSEYDV